MSTKHTPLKTRMMKMCLILAALLLLVPADMPNPERAARHTNPQMWENMHEIEYLGSDGLLDWEREGSE